MIIIDEERVSDSPFVERIWCSHSEGERAFLSIAVNHCELVVSRLQGKVTMTLRGPETKATPMGNAPAEGEWVGILLKLGTFLPHLPTSRLVDGGVDLPTASSNSFWLGGSVWQFPDSENADIFVERLVREGLLRRSPVVEAALQGQLKDLTQRAVQYRFLQVTGITQSTARQIERARYATLLLQQGVSILDTIEQAGYYDQPHLTRSLGRFINSTPKYVFSTTLESVEAWQNSTLLKGDLAQEIARLRQQPGKNIGTAGSPTLVRSLLEQGLLDELILLVHPVVAGSGKRLFKDGDSLKRLNLLSAKPTRTGTVILTYQPRKA